MKYLRMIVAAVVLSLPLFLKANVIHVPGDYPTIQAAIDASVSGDTIVVQPATYYENINFRGKNVFLTSLFYLDADTTYINSTIIDGSAPAFPDTASCVIFCSGEDSTAVLQGFTLTGGGGTKWLDAHGAGTYREGGGVLIEFSSPMVLHNVITNNACNDLSGVVSTGGGGIRVGDGNPVIANNRITFNEARYGPGIVLNYTGCTITNNIIASNTGGEEFTGGSGIWILRNKGTLPKIITNNTIVNNVSVLTGGTGGIFVWMAGNVFIKNNIIYGNLPSAQIKVNISTPVVSYCNVQGGYAGVGNINENPLFEPSSYFLTDASPCIDAGDTAMVYLDLEDPEDPGMALFPSRGGLRNDIGAYGGPGASLLPSFNTVYVGLGEQPPVTDRYLIYPNPSSGRVNIQGRGEVRVYNILGEEVHSAKLSDDQDPFQLYLPDGIYLVRGSNGSTSWTEKLVVK